MAAPYSIMNGLRKVTLSDCFAFSSVEPGMEILAPFDTPVGKVGSTICFDVSLVYYPTA